jgi:hypothetical protein
MEICNRSAKKTAFDLVLRGNIHFNKNAVENVFIQDRHFMAQEQQCVLLFSYHHVFALDGDIIGCIPAGKFQASQQR